MNWAEIITTLKQYSGLGVSLVGVAFITSKMWWPYVSNLKIPFVKNSDVKGPNPAADVADVGALHLLQARAERRNCPKLKQALRDVEVNFFNYTEKVA